jgi:hypothetical protein
VTAPDATPAETPHRLRKALALVVAALLVTAFVLYRAGVIGPAYMSSSKSTFVFVGSSIAPSAEPPPPAPPRE